MYDSIALCFSGGGYRAATFSLGTLSLLEKVGLLQNVKAISTVSGGTITGVKYAQSQLEGDDFDTFFKEYYQWLFEDTLTRNAITHLRKTNVWRLSENKHKRRNPINAFAIEYNKFTNYRTLGETQENIIEEKTHLERVIFNATDFDNTTQFRFQNIKGNQRRFGNGKVHSLYKDVINDIKLGDVIAASTAFPGGFEPIGFPNDFTPKFPELKEIGLMDGGIVDNQGSSVFTSESSDSKDKYDLYFISDVSSPYSGIGFKFASKSKFSKYTSIFSKLTTLVIALVFTIFFFIKEWFVLYTIGVIMSSFLAVIQGVFLFASYKMQQETGLSQKLYLPPNRVGFYLVNRMKSLLRMAGVVFLKNDRRQHASALYSMFPKKSITSTVYELRCLNKEGDQTCQPEYVKNWDEISKHTGSISSLIIANSKKSADFGTTLWFSKEDESNNILDTVIACGEYTACYNLLAHMITNHKDNLQTIPLYQELLLLWNEFQKNPFYLVEQRKIKYRNKKL